MLGSVLDVLFPRRCVGCGGRGWPFCSACSRGVRILIPPWCGRCGRPFEDGVRPVVQRCPDCPPPSVSWSRSPFLYAGPVRHALMRLKFSGSRSVAEALAPAMLAWLRDSPYGQRAPPDQTVLVTWVPLGKRRRRARGYDQAEALARAVGGLAGWPVARLLTRSVETSPQARRGGADRKLALTGAFRVASGPPPDVLLVDDVLTSGATVGECARVLRRAGAREVGVLTVARSLGETFPTRCYNPAGAPAWVCGCPGDGLSEVDASRRRNDPRKATRGR
jgi:ComF family protein